MLDTEYCGDCGRYEARASGLAESADLGSRLAELDKSTRCFSEETACTTLFFHRPEN